MNKDFLDLALTYALEWSVTPDGKAYFDKLFEGFSEVYKEARAEYERKNLDAPAIRQQIAILGRQTTANRRTRLGQSRPSGRQLTAAITPRAKA